MGFSLFDVIIGGEVMHARKYKVWLKIFKERCTYSWGDMIKDYKYVIYLAITEKREYASVISSLRHFV